MGGEGEGAGEYIVMTSNYTASVGIKFIMGAKIVPNHAIASTAGDTDSCDKEILYYIGN